MKQQINKIITLINNAINTEQFETITRYNFSNMGVIAIQHKNKFGDLAHVHFDIQSGSATFRLNIAGQNLIRRGREKNKYCEYYCTYTDEATFNEFIDDLNTRVLDVLMQVH